MEKWIFWRVDRDFSVGVTEPDRKMVVMLNRGVLREIFVPTSASHTRHGEVSQLDRFRPAPHPNNGKHRPNQTDYSQQITQITGNLAQQGQAIRATAKGYNRIKL